jgi:hypothetical protein
MAEPFTPVSSLDDLNSLDEEEVLAGYRDYKRGDPEPGPNRGRAYWHGWMNAARDDGERPTTTDTRQLAREYLRAQRKATHV